MIHQCSAIIAITMAPWHRPSCIHSFAHPSLPAEGYDIPVCWRHRGTGEDGCDLSRKEMQGKGGEGEGCWLAFSEGCCCRLFTEKRIQGKACAGGQGWGCMMSRATRGSPSRDVHWVLGCEPGAQREAGRAGSIPAVAWGC